MNETEYKFEIINMDNSNESINKKISFSVNSDIVLSAMQNKNLSLEDLAKKINEKIVNGEDIQQALKDILGADDEHFSIHSAPYPSDNPSILNSEDKNSSSFFANSDYSDGISSLPMMINIPNLPFSRKSFEEIDYEKEIFPQLKTQIAHFKKSSSSLRILLWPTLLAFALFQVVIGLCALIQTMTLDHLIIFELIGLALIGGYALTQNPLNVVAQDTMMTSILAKVGAYLMPGFIDKSLIAQSKLVNVADIVRKDEFIKINKEYQLNVLECSIGIVGLKNPYTYILIALKFNNRSINSHTVINPIHPSPFTIKIPEDFKKIDLELQEFNKKYKVYSTDEVESRVICSLDFMEKIIELEKNFETNKVSCAFFKEYAILSIQTERNFFSINIANKEETQWEQEYNLVIEELSSIADMVEQLNLLELYK